VTQPVKRLEAPHRRLQTSPRIIEKIAVVGYKSAAGLLAHLPPRFSAAVVGRLNQAGYLVWPSKQRFSNLNFSKVLGLPPSHPDVRRLALRAYKEYGWFVVETMRLPSMKTETVQQLVEGDGMDRIVDAFRAHGKSMIVIAGHVGNNEAVAAGVAHRGLPANVVADDSAFPEIFEILRRNRESWGVHVVPWRNLRELFTILRKNQMLALLVDWGYKPDDIPVKLFGAWTTLPAGPATLAAKTGAIIAPMVVRRLTNGHFRVDTDVAFTVDASDPATIQRATQRIADALERTIGAAPEQWYNFKPMWPFTDAEAAVLERRAAEMLAGRPGAGPAGAGPAAGGVTARAAGTAAPAAVDGA
jgi:KDO2-lipid IV(A) lauroyltransferase